MHNILSESQGPYNKRNKPRPYDARSSSGSTVTDAELEEVGVDSSSDVGRVLGTGLVSGDDE